AQRRESPPWRSLQRRGTAETARPRASSSPGGARGSVASSARTWSRRLPTARPQPPPSRASHRRRSHERDRGPALAAPAPRTSRGPPREPPERAEIRGNSPSAPDGGGSLRFASLHHEGARFPVPPRFASGWAYLQINRRETQVKRHLRFRVVHQTLCDV